MAEAAAPAAPVLLESLNAGVLTLTLNRPERLNALNVELGQALVAGMERAAADPGIRAVVLTGAGRGFCAGGDLGLLSGLRESGRGRELEPLLRAGVKYILAVRTMQKPVIAAVNGPAAGGGMNVALGCDFRIASERASFGQSFTKIGLFPDFGGTYLLPRLVGEARAAELFYHGDMIPAQEAQRIGVVNRVVPHDRLLPEVQELAARVAAGPPLAIQAVKSVVFGGDRAALERALEFEVEQQMRCYFSEDASEGIRAFLEKRLPNFKGK
jgi:2-(1,2-epoxy-1,2-dihydrophenyl)acetyl-CoA isomerase